MKNTIEVHPATKKRLLEMYLLIYLYCDEVAVKHARLARVTKTTLKAQTRCWPPLCSLLLFCREKVIKEERFERIHIPNLATLSSDEILVAIIRS